MLFRSCLPLFTYERLISSADMQKMFSFVKQLSFGKTAFWRYCCFVCWMRNPPYLVLCYLFVKDFHFNWRKRFRRKGVVFLENIHYELRGHIAIVTLNRPDALNAFNYHTLEELQRTVELIRTSRDIRVVVFTGAGEKAFSVGADLKERRTLADEDVKRNI